MPFVAKLLSELVKLKRNLNKYLIENSVYQWFKHIYFLIKKGAIKPYERVIRANIGDCHATGQKPITFLRQVFEQINFLINL